MNTIPDLTSLLLKNLYRDDKLTGIFNLFARAQFDFMVLLNTDPVQVDPVIIIQYSYDFIQIYNVVLTCVFRE